jgi:capsular polysaccharide export protein
MDQPISSKKLSETKTIGIMSRGMAKIPYLDILLGNPIAKSFAGKFRVPIHFVAGWGHKPSAQTAKDYAEKNALPYIAIEDGFLRSVKLGKYDPPLSLILDDIGIYYNAHRPSRLEQLIRKELSESERLRAEDLIIEWKKARVSKYNYLKEIDPAKLPEKYVLLADQTKGDASVELGLADTSSFQRMLNAALKEHPDCTVLIKIHPEVVAGIKKGYFDLTKLDKIPRVIILTDDVHPIRLIEHAEAVYAVTSQIGFEALLWGKSVRTFGMPFYAGWGLTKDEIDQPDRRKNVDLTQLTHAALIEYPSYLHPETNERCQVEDLIDWIAFQRKMRAKFPEKLYALNFSWNKKQSIKKFFSNSEVSYIKREEQAKPNTSMLVWGSTEIKRKDLKIIRLEDGFIRSVGLGADLIRPMSWVADMTGIYYDPTAPSDLETLLSTFVPDTKMLERAKKLRETIVTSGLTKYNLTGSNWTKPKHLRSNQKIILVPGQVESDASIAKGALDIKTNYELLQAVRQANPVAYILYKPHPDVVAGLRKSGDQEVNASNICDELIENASITALIDQCDEIHVLTSLTGFEALLRDRKVVVYGQPFYSGWGLTTDRTHDLRRTRSLTLDQLVAGVLIEYSLYLAKTKKILVSPESAIDIFLKTQKTKLLFGSQRKALRRLLVKLTTPAH